MPRIDNPPEVASRYLELQLHAEPTLTGGLPFRQSRRIDGPLYGANVVHRK